MKRTRIALAGVAALAIGFIFLAGSPCWAHGGGGRFGGGFVDENGDGINDVTGLAHEMAGRMGGPFGLNLKNLTLSTDQQTQIDKLKADNQTAVTPLVTALQTKETELRALRTAATPDQAAITAKIAEMDAIRSQIQTANTSYRDSVLNVLTADQRGTLEAQRLGLKGITLTTDQLTQIDKLMSDHQTTASSLQTTLKARETELRSLMTATSPDKSAINAKIDEISGVQSQLQKENAAFQVAVRGLLTSDQQAALDAARAAGGPGAGGRHHGRGRGMGFGHR